MTTLFISDLHLHESRPAVTEALEILNRAYDYANPDYLSTSWGDINDRYVADDAGDGQVLEADPPHAEQPEAFLASLLNLSCGLRDAYREAIPA